MKADRIQGAWFVEGSQGMLRIAVGHKEFDVYIGNAFSPTDTSRLLIESALPLAVPSTRLLDLGCGTGVVGLVIAQLASLPTVFLSDIHDASLASVNRNFERVGQKFEFRCGDLFEPWSGQAFDLIIDDVSGVSEVIAKRSRWFEGVPCNSGVDGTALVCQVIDQARMYLNANGRFIFPVISLSRTDKIVAAAKARFSRVTSLGTKDWPLPQELLEDRVLLESLAGQGAITLIRRFGMLLGRTEVFLAEGPLA